MSLRSVDFAYGHPCRLLLLNSPKIHFLLYFTSLTSFLILLIGSGLWSLQVWCGLRIRILSYNLTPSFCGFLRHQASNFNTSYPSTSSFTQQFHKYPSPKHQVREEFKHTTQYQKPRITWFYLWLKNAKLRMVAHSYNNSIWEAEPGGSHEFKDSLNFIGRPYILKRVERRKWEKEGGRRKQW